MARSVLGALKDAVLILDEVHRLNDHIRKLVQRMERLEDRVQVLETERAVGAARDEALIDRFEAASRSGVAVAAAQVHAQLLERIVKLEAAVNGVGPRPARKIGPSRPK